MGKLSMNKNPEMKEITGGQSRGELLDTISRLEKSAVTDIAVSKVKTDVPFKELFPVKEELLESIIGNMKQNGFDRTQPLIIWKEKDTLLDGHTRLKAVKEAGIKEIPVVYVSLSDKEAAVDYAYGLQFKRRNMDEAEKFQFTESYLGHVAQKGKNESGWKKEELATLLSCSSRTAQRYITVLKNASKADKDAIIQGEKTINQVYNLLRSSDERRALKESKPSNQVKFNKNAGEELPNKKVISIDEDLIKKTVKSWENDENYILRVSSVSQIIPPMTEMKVFLESIVFKEKTKNT